MSCRRPRRNPPAPRGATLAAAAGSCLSLTLSVLVAVARGGPCPEEMRAHSLSLGGPLTVEFENQAGEDVVLRWVNNEGEELQPRYLSAHGTAGVQTFHGHVFHVRSRETNVLLLRYQAPKAALGRPVPIKRCTGMPGGMAPKPDQVNKQRWAEFEHLVHDADAPCVGPSSNWSCVRYVSPEELARRTTANYGYHEGETDGTAYRVGQTEDHLFKHQQGFIPNVTAYEGGFLKMDMTDRLRELLYPWYEHRLRDAVGPHDDIPGGFSNIQRVRFRKIELARPLYAHVMRGIQDEMQAVLEWWTKMRLRHSQTFGVRIYTRDAMLVNHLDRKDTHIASAILQVGQKVDQDGGWPVEVIHPHRPGLHEVYLHPGQMLLYEGARIVHGRPMRFKGEEFANIFSHFAPLDWHGADLRIQNRFFKREPAEL